VRVDVHVGNLIEQFERLRHLSRSRHPYSIDLFGEMHQCGNFYGINFEFNPAC
jgi:hypothetical protein